MDARILFDPVVLIVLALVVLALVWRFSGYRNRKVGGELARLRVQAKEETNPRKRQEILQRFHELGGVKETQRIQAKQSAKDEGRKACMNGRSRFSNPYGLGFWGKGRLWRQGWKSVEQNIRWIEKHRE
ncbi:MAG: hypothetical protein V3S64_06095 [bacterium]